MTGATIDTRPRPGRHRSAAADAAILDATISLLRDRGYDALTMAAVIENAGVSSATLYRRWTTKSELVAAAIASLAPDECIDIDTGSLEGDLGAFLRHVTRTMAARGNLSSLLRPGEKQDADLVDALKAKLLTPRLQTLQGILDRAAARGEITRRPPAETYLSLLVGPLMYRSTVLDEPVTPAFLRHLLRHALAGLRE